MTLIKTENSRDTSIPTLKFKKVRVKEFKTFIGLAWRLFKRDEAFSKLVIYTVLYDDKRMGNNKFKFQT